MQYTHRLHQFTKERDWTVRGDHLYWRDSDGAEGHILYKDVRFVRLRFEPTRTQLKRYVMRIGARGEEVITSIHYRGVYDFEDRAAAFRDFVTDFHARLAEANPAVSYLKGSTPGAYIGNILALLVAALVVVSAALFVIGVGMIWLIPVKIALILFYLPTAIRLLNKNRPGSYAPTSIPAELLPAG